MLITTTMPTATSCLQNVPSSVPSPATHATNSWLRPAFGTYGTCGALNGNSFGIEGCTSRVPAPVSIMRDRGVVGADVKAAKQGRPPRGELH